jgi:hypothetical protein
MSIVRIISKLFSMQNEKIAPINDPTQYRIVTSSHEYVGSIVHQDDTIIRFRTSQDKPIKIVKTNIQYITTINAQAWSLIRQETQDRDINQPNKSFIK